MTAEAAGGGASLVEDKGGAAVEIAILFRLAFLAAHLADLNIKEKYNTSMAA